MYDLKTPSSPRTFEEYLRLKQSKEETRRQAREAVEIAKHLGWKPPKREL